MMLSGLVFRRAPRRAAGRRPAADRDRPRADRPRDAAAVDRRAGRGVLVGRGEAASRAQQGARAAVGRRPGVLPRDVGRHRALPVRRGARRPEGEEPGQPVARRLGRGVRGRRREPRRHVRRPGRPPVRLRLERPDAPRAQGRDAAGRPLRPGGVGARLPDGDRAAVVGDRCDAEGRGRDRPRRPRQRQRRDGSRGQAHVVGRGGPGQRRPAPLRAGHAAADCVGRARRTSPPSRRPRATCARKARRGRRSASSTTTSAPTRPG